MTRQSAQPHPVQGFTLIEVVLAIAITALIGIYTHTLFYNFNTAKETVGVRSDRLAELSRAFFFIEQDIEQILSRPVRDEYGSGDYLGAVVGREQELEFSRTGWTRSPFTQRPRSDLQRVRYEIEKGTFYRLYWNVLDRVEDSEPLRAALAQGVEELTFRFYGGDGGGGVNPSAMSEWPGAGLAGAQVAQDPEDGSEPSQSVDEALPKVIEVVVTVEGIGEITRQFLVSQLPEVDN